MPVTRPGQQPDAPRDSAGTGERAAGSSAPTQPEIVAEESPRPPPTGRLGLCWIKSRWGLLKLVAPAACRDFWRGLDRIEELSAGRQLPELAEAVRSECRRLAPAGLLGMLQLRLGWPWLRMRHPAAQRNPCLYITMLCLAFESAAGRRAEVNVLLADGQDGAVDGHCWLTWQGKVLHGTKEPGGDCEPALPARQGSVVYWWRGGASAPRAVQLGGPPLAAGRKPWPI